jgi:uncharacterized coiled-coil protein SlyX
MLKMRIAEKKKEMENLSAQLETLVGKLEKYESENP